MCLLKIPIPYKNSIENFIKKIAEQMFRHNINIILLVCLLLL